MRGCIGVLVVAWCLGWPAAPDAPAQGGTPQYRTGIDLVPVDVTVLSRAGDPVADLQPADFSLTVDGRARRILEVRRTTSGKVESTGAPAAPPPSTGLPALASLPRHFVLVIDRAQIPVGEGRTMLVAAAKFVDTLAPEDRVALWTTTENSGRLQFGEDRESLKKRVLLAVGTARASFARWTVGRDEAIRAEDNDPPETLGQIIDRECTGRPGHIVNDDSSRKTCRVEVTAQVKQTALEARAAAEQALANIENLVRALAPLDGPKHVVLVTQGLVLHRDAMTRVASMGRLAATARVTIHALQVHEPSYQARTDRMRAMPDTIDQGRSMEYSLAGTTGGLAVTPVTGEIAFTRLSHQLATGYLLVFETEEGDRDGREHAIDVKVRGVGQMALVRARRAFRVDRAAAAAAPPPAPPVATETTAAPAPAAPVVPPEPVGIDPGDMARRLADYVEAFERDITAIVAEERSVQIIQPWRGMPSGPHKEPALQWIEPGAQSAKPTPTISRRQLVADVLMVQRAGQQWQSYRDVSEVDGRSIRDRESRVQRLFLSGDRAAFQQIALESSRYNIGDIKRDLNLPTIALSFLRRANHPRFQFKRQKDEAVDGRVCRVLAYREKKSPTLVATRNSGDVFLYGRVWLDQADGRVRRTELRFDRGFTGSATAAGFAAGQAASGTGVGGFRSCITVDFGPLEGSVTLVPSRMWEWHEGVNQLGRIGGDVTGLQSSAVYSNYRRFQVSTSESLKK